MIVETRRQTKVVTVVDNIALTVPAEETSYVVTGADIDIADFATGMLLITAGSETATATLDVVFQVKDSNGNYYTHTSATQVTQAGSSVKAIAQLDGETGRVVVTLGDAAADAFAGVTVELVLKS